MASITSSHDDDSHAGLEEVDPAAQRKLTSTVWNSFKKLKKPNGETVAICNHCSANFVGDGGTSHLRNHLKRKHQELIADSESSSGVLTYKFNQERSRKDLATMIIKHNYPLSIVDHHWFRIYSHGLNPDFNIILRNTMRSDIINIHKEEKEKMYAFLENLDCKITVTTDIWTSDHQNLAYTCLAVHFIDDNWELKKKILAYRHIEYPHDGQTLFKFIRDLILQWNIDKKLFAMVVDNASSNDVMVRLLKTWLGERSLLSLEGNLFHVRCSAHILNLVVQDGLKVIQGLVEKIRQTVRYLKSLTYAKQKFDTAVNQVRLKDKKKLPADVPNRWNSTYLMLKVAISMREALNRLSDLDRLYKFYPSDEEWEVAITINECLKVFYERSTYVTRVTKAFYDLFKEYNNASGGIQTRQSRSNISQSCDRFSGFDQWCERDEPHLENQESEADAYLKEPLFPREAEFSLLQWWKVNASKYPVLAKIARDVLAVPATTVASESAFSVGGRKLDETRSSMLPELVEALVTTADWIEEI